MYIQLNSWLILNRRKTTFIILCRIGFFTYSRVFLWGPFVRGVSKMIKSLKLYSALRNGIIWNNKMGRWLKKKTLFSPAKDCEETHRLLETSLSFVLFHWRSPTTAFGKKSGKYSGVFRPVLIASLFEWRVLGPLGPSLFCWGNKAIIRSCGKISNSWGWVQSKSSACGLFILYFQESCSRAGRMRNAQ